MGVRKGKPKVFSRGMYASLFDYQRFGDKPQVLTVYAFDGQRWFKNGAILNPDYLPEDLLPLKFPMS